MNNLKWKGDFSIPRLRASLANKNLLHPFVEPDYAEVYRSDRSSMTIVRRDVPDYMASTMPMFSMSRLESKLDSRGFSLSSTSFRDLPTSKMWQTGPMGQPTSMSRTSSVPCLGSRRMARISTAPSFSSSMGFTETKPSEKEKQMEILCRRLWTVSNGGEYLPKEQFILVSAEEPQAPNSTILQRLAQTPVPGVDKVLKQGALLDWKNPDWNGATLLMKFVRTGSLIMAMYCIAKKADPKVVDNAGRGLLHWAALESHANIFNYLIENHTDLPLDAPDNGGDTPLHLAAYSGNLPIVKMLILKNVDIHVENDAGFTAQQLAEARRMWHVASYLTEYRQHENDKAVASQGQLELRCLVRACDLERANEVKATLALKPKAKKKEAPKKKK